MKRTRYFINLSITLLIVLISTVTVYFTHKPLFGSLDVILSDFLRRLLHKTPFTSKIFSPFFGVYIFYLLGGLAVGHSIGKNKIIRALLVALAFLTLGYVVEWLKALTSIPRPQPVAPGYSFPSGHAAQAFLAAGIGWKESWIRVSLIVLAVIIALSRIYFGAHYISDVLIGGLLGWFWGGLFTPPIFDLR